MGFSLIPRVLEKGCSMDIKITKAAGFTLVEVMVVAAIIGFVAAIGVPNFLHYRAAAQAKTCIASLKQLQGAMELWAMENKMKDGDPCALGNLIPNYLKTTPQCAASSAYYTITTVGALPQCPNYSAADNELKMHSLAAAQ
jgi:prepilin-type N-terminal cleavage/methylation domain-containing protein